MKVKYPKNAMKTMYREFKNLHLGKKFERYLSLFASICWATVAVGFLYIGYGFLQMEGEIEGSIYETNKKAGTHYIGHVRTKKYAPAPPKEHKTMVGIAVDYHGIRQYSVKRKMANPFGMGIWGGVFIQEGQHQKLGNMFAAGLSLDISF